MNKGFTFLEVLAAMMIMTIGLIPIMRILPEAMKYTRRVERLTKASFLAQSKMDEIRSQIIGTDESYGFEKLGGYSSSGNFSSDPKYRYTITDNRASDIKQISVIVWFDEDNDSSQDTEEQSIRLDTKIADRG